MPEACKSGLCGVSVHSLASVKDRSPALSLSWVLPALCATPEFTARSLLPSPCPQSGPVFPFDPSRLPILSVLRGSGPYQLARARAKPSSLATRCPSHPSTAVLVEYSGMGTGPSLPPQRSSHPATPGQPVPLHHRCASDLVLPRYLSLSPAFSKQDCE